jgi:hypothetical protein
MQHFFKVNKNIYVFLHFMYPACLFLLYVFLMYTNNIHARRITHYCVHACYINNSSLKVHAGWIINHKLSVPSACLFKIIRQHYASLAGWLHTTLTHPQQAARQLYVPTGYHAGNTTHSLDTYIPQLDGAGNAVR